MSDIKKMDKMPEQARVASFVPATLNEESRTVELVWTTGASVRRYDFFEDEVYEEVLSLDRAHIRSERLDSGAMPVLKDHRNSVDSVVGVVESWSVDGNEGKCSVRFGSDEEADKIFQKVKEGILRNISVGYQVFGYTITRADGQMPVYTATDWMPLEISVVGVPADAGATTRSLELNDVDVEKTKTETETRDNDVSVNPPEEKMTDKNEILEQEKARVREIRKAARSLNLTENQIDDLIDSDLTVDQARAQIIELASKAQVEIRTVVKSGSSETLDNPEFKRAAIEDALVARAVGGKFEGAAAEFKSTSLVGAARELTGMFKQTPDVVVEHAMAVTSDFPSLLGNVANKSLIRLYEAAAPTYTQWAVRRDFNDFKAHSMVSLGDFPALATKAENGDYSEGTIGEAAQSITPAEFGKIYHLSRAALINDDLGSFSEMARQAAFRARSKENALVYSVLTTNGNLSDGEPLFGTVHANKAGTGANPSKEAISVGRIAMMTQTGIDGIPLNIGPSILLCGPAQELNAAQAVGLISPVVDTEVNPFSGKIRVIVDASISGDDWYLLADPLMAPVVSYGYVQGRGPWFKTDTRFESQSVKFLLGLDFGAGAVDYRGGFFNDGPDA